MLTIWAYESAETAAVPRSVASRLSMHHAAADHDRREVADDVSHRLQGGVDREAEMLRVAEDRRHLHGELRERADDHPPRRDHDQRAVVRAPAEEHQRRDHHDVHEDRRDVREKEFAVAVENAEAPGGENQDADARPHDADHRDRQLADRTLVAGGDDHQQPRRQQDAEEDEHRHRQREERGDDARHAAGRLFVVLREQPRIDRDE
jgi:hypothetical protein